MTDRFQDSVEDIAAEQRIRARANRSLVILSTAMYRRFGRWISLLPDPPICIAEEEL
jgi:hypothetical protein